MDSITFDPLGENEPFIASAGFFGGKVCSRFQSKLLFCTIYYYYKLSVLPQLKYTAFTIATSSYYLYQYYLYYNYYFFFYPYIHPGILRMKNITTITTTITTTDSRQHYYWLYTIITTSTTTTTTYDHYNLHYLCLKTNSHT